MTRGKEAQLQDRFCKWLRGQGCKVFKQQMNATTRAGTPDVFAFKAGLWIWIEFKKSKNAKKRPGQQENINWAKENSFGYFVYPENEKEVKKELKEILRD